MIRALHEVRLPGLTTNIPLLLRTLEDQRFVSGSYDTSILDDSAPAEEDPQDLVPMIAAALAKHRRVRKAAVPPPAAPAASAWIEAGRGWWQRR